MKLYGVKSVRVLGKGHSVVLQGSFPSGDQRARLTLCSQGDDRCSGGSAAAHTAAAESAAHPFAADREQAVRRGPAADPYAAALPGV